MYHGLLDPLIVVSFCRPHPTSCFFCSMGDLMLLAYTRGSHMSCVEAFAIGIKIESSDPALLGTDQGIKVASKLLKSMTQERAAAI